MIYFPEGSIFNFYFFQLLSPKHDIHSVIQNAKAEKQNNTDNELITITLFFLQQSIIIFEILSISKKKKNYIPLHINSIDFLELGFMNFVLLLFIVMYRIDLERNLLFFVVVFYCLLFQFCWSWFLLSKHIWSYFEYYFT